LPLERLGFIIGPSMATSIDDSSRVVNPRPNAGRAKRGGDEEGPDLSGKVVRQLGVRRRACRARRVPSAGSGADRRVAGEVGLSRCGKKTPVQKI